MSGWKNSRGQHRNWQPPGWKATRRRILNRDNHRCRACGATDRLEVDHIVPVTSGGSHDDDNLQTLCRTCHDKKSAREGVAARPTRKRPPDKHPGLL